VGREAGVPHLCLLASPPARTRKRVSRRSAMDITASGGVELLLDENKESRRRIPYTRAGALPAPASVRRPLGWRGSPRPTRLGARAAHSESPTLPLLAVWGAVMYELLVVYS
jgi:hypothetical protein